MRVMWMVGSATASVLLLAGCGGSAEEAPTGDASASQTADDAGSEPSSAGFDPASATLPDGPFCDQVDTALVAQAVGTPEGKVKLVRTVEVGQEYTPGPGLPPQQATANACEYGTGSGFVVSIAPNSPAELQRARAKEALEREQEKPGKNTIMYTKCSAEETTAVGSDGYLESCELVGSTSSPRRTAAVSGMAGGSRFSCVLVRADKGNAAELAQPLTETCVSLMEQLAEG